jgi:hypothetical protein
METRDAWRLKPLQQKAQSLPAQAKWTSGFLLL